MTENELIHFGIKGMKWGVRRTPAQLARARSSAYSNEKKEWTREPEGGGLKKQVAVIDAQKRLKSARISASKKEARAELKQAKKNLKDGYKEYQTFEKDMHKKYGKLNQYIYDPDTKKYMNKKTKRTIEDYEYKGLADYETYKDIRTQNITNAVMAFGSAAVITLLTAKNGIGTMPYRG